MKKITLEDIQPGKSLRIFYDEGNLSNCTIHVRAIVDEDEYVIMEWSTRKGWIHRMHPRIYFKFLLDNNRIKKIWKTKS